MASNPSTEFFENPCGIMYPRGYDEDWGKGGYLIPDNFEISIYKSRDNSEILGTLRKKNGFLTLKDSSKNLIQYDLKDFEWIGQYSVAFLKVYESEGDYIKVLCKSFDSGLYIRKSELNQKMVFFTYYELLFSETLPAQIKKNQSVALGINLNNNCLNLRQEPNINGKKIRCILGNDINPKGFSDIRILNHKGNWAYVEVIFCEWNDIGDEDDCGIEVNREIGWLKAIDENGFPNIWYAVTAY